MKRAGAWSWTKPCCTLMHCVNVSTFNVYVLVWFGLGWSGKNEGVQFRSASTRGCGVYVSPNCHMVTHFANPYTRLPYHAWEASLRCTLLKVWHLCPSSNPSSASGLLLVTHLLAELHSLLLLHDAACFHLRQSLEFLDHCKESSMRVLLFKRGVGSSTCRFPKTHLGSTSWKLWVPPEKLIDSTNRLKHSRSSAEKIWRSTQASISTRYHWATVWAQHAWSFMRVILGHASGCKMFGDRSRNVFDQLDQFLQFSLYHLNPSGAYCMHVSPME